MYGQCQNYDGNRSRMSLEIEASGDDLLLGCDVNETELEVFRW